MRSLVLGTLALVFGACVEPTAGSRDAQPTDGGSDADGQNGEEIEPDMLKLIQCDSDLLLDRAWQIHETEHFRIHYLPGTPAEQDLQEIALTREAVYSQIIATLGLTTFPTIDAHFSPSRAVARAHGLWFGAAFPSDNRYEAIYTGADGSFESVHYGHLVSAILARYVDPTADGHLQVLTTGIRENLDGANRDLHTVFASRMNSGSEALTYFASLSERDVWGQDIGRAGSLVSFLAGRYGWATFTEIYRNTRLTWQDGCFRKPGDGCVDTPAAASSVLADAIRQATQDEWSEIQILWAQTVMDALWSTDSALDESDRAEIENILLIMDRAITNDDPHSYRTAMDGFYCEWADDEARLEIARRVVSSMPGVRSRLVAAYRNPIKNFEEAIALVERIDDRGVISQQRLKLERFPDGWRTTWSDDWR